ncbi:MAG: hypothetical protein ACYSUM_12400 [Planctomycetota bacterium]|jgi:hypothetical protein
MWKLVATLTLAAVAIGCTSDGDILGFNPQALVDNFETSVDTHQLMSEYGFAAARGELDITGSEYDYVPPDDQGNPGTLTITNGNFPFGTGDLLVTFTAEGDAGFVDPYGAGVDLSDDTVVTVVASVAFGGTTPEGQSLGTLADFTVQTVQNDVDTATTTVTGNFGVAVDDYITDFVANDVEMTFDLANDRVTNVTGAVDGSMDVPDLAFDVDFLVTGLGDHLQIGIDAVTTQIDYFVDIDEL